MKKYISRFHYLTHDIAGFSHADQVRMACESGANWIQYRCLSKTEPELLEEIHEIAAICDDWGATLILTDHYNLLDRVDAQGVHIEDMNADFAGIRKVIGEDKTFGASANTPDDVLRLASLGVVDYIGCGPFSTTLTKPNNYPLLGAAGYRDIVNGAKSREIQMPLIAVGGIRIADVEDILETGVHGIAVCSAINLAEEPSEVLKTFYKKVY